MSERLVTQVPRPSDSDASADQPDADGVPTTEAPGSPASAPGHPHHVRLPVTFEALGEELREDTPAEATMLAKAIGGWRGVIDSSLPSLVFLIFYLSLNHQLKPAIWAAVISGALIAGWRLIRRQSVQQVLAGFVGVAISAFVAAKTGSAVNYFLPGLLINAAYGLALLVSVLVRWPMVGVLLGAATGDISGWRSDVSLRRAYAAATWVWVAMFFSRIAVQVPLYFLGLVGPLGIAKIAMGWPLQLLAGWWTYKLVKPPMAAARERAREERAAGPSDPAGSLSE